MSNYRSYIHVSHLWPARPSISPADAGCETGALSLSTQPPWKVACSVLACHPSPFPLDCSSCVTVPLTDHWPHWGHAGGWSNMSLGSVTSRQGERKTLRYLYSSNILIDSNHFIRGTATSWLLTLLFIKDRTVKPLPRGGRHWKGLENCQRTNAGWNNSISQLCRLYWHWKDQVDSVVYTNCRMRRNLDLDELPVILTGYSAEALTQLSYSPLTRSAVPGYCRCF